MGDHRMNIKIEIEKTTTNRKEVWHKAYLLLKTP